MAEPGMDPVIWRQSTRTKQGRAVGTESDLCLQVSFSYFLTPLGARVKEKRNVSGTSGQLPALPGVRLSGP
jgi:hypothetical protein